MTLPTQKTAGKVEGARSKHDEIGLSPAEIRKKEVEIRAQIEADVWAWVEAEVRAQLEAEKHGKASQHTGSRKQQLGTHSALPFLLFT